MRTKHFYLILFLLLTLCKNVAISQDSKILSSSTDSVKTASDTLSPINAQYSQKLLDILQLDSIQKKQIDLVLLQYQNKFSNIEARRKIIENSVASEDDIIKEVSILNQEKQGLRKEKEVDILLVLDSNQKKDFEEKVKTAKPSVLHFGIHNRADCIICK